MFKEQQGGRCHPSKGVRYKKTGEVEREQAVKGFKCQTGFSFLILKVIGNLCTLFNLWPWSGRLI